MRFCLLNCENLFIYLDFWQGQDILRLNEQEWQSLSTAQTSNKSLFKTKWLANTINEIDADIVMLNEVGGIESLENFNRHFLKNRYQPLLIEGNSDRGIDVGYLLKPDLPYKSILLSHRLRPIPLRYDGDPEPNLFLPGLAPEKPQKKYYFSRDVAELRLFDPKTNQLKLIVLLVHFKSPLDPEKIDPHGKLKRAAELKEVVNIYHEIRRETPNLPVMLAGDFNGQARRMLVEEEFLPLHKETDLQDVFDLCRKPTHECVTQMSFSRGPSGRHIDHIFVSKELATMVQPEETFVYMYKSEGVVTLPYPVNLEQRNALPSDHYPVVTTVSLS